MMQSMVRGKMDRARQSGLASTHMHMHIIHVYTVDTHMNIHMYTYLDTHMNCMIPHVTMGKLLNLSVCWYPSLHKLRYTRHI